MLKYINGLTSFRIILHPCGTFLSHYFKLNLLQILQKFFKLDPNPFVMTSLVQNGVLHAFNLGFLCSTHVNLLLSGR